MESHVFLLTNRHYKQLSKEYYFYFSCLVPTLVTTDFSEPQAQGQESDFSLGSTDLPG